MMNITGRMMTAEGMMDLVVKIGQSTVFAGGIGYAAGSALMYGGRLWTWLKGSEQGVLQERGHIGTSEYRRQLSVGLAAATAVALIWECVEGIIFQNSYRYERFMELLGDSLMAVATAIMGSLAAKKVTPQNYLILSKSGLAFVSFSLAYRVYQVGLEQFLV